ncbi:PilZ domain-containing protein [Clostridium sp. ZS2-4]|uniref:PilZ domain-containing protein n=1 Tax=Clostridium sp. ZS2-4 TaxID=2987703 RepID=UPI00227CF3B1|nr:PilZ domain-containing protein [Clostridium sp. ZS2-4]MCY6354242.1 PilZ domain-containing protein [Clostridium sp. ZS2-4]
MEYMHNIYNYKKLKLINLNFNRRKFFRLELRNTEYSKLSIVEINGKKIETKYANIRIKDIGPSGLAFISKLDFPNDENILFKFVTKILNKTIEVKGNIVRKNKYEDSVIFQYGVKFKLDKNEEIRYQELLKNILIESRRLNKYNYYYTPLNKLQI